MADVLSVLLLIVMFFLSIWNAYASGFNIGMVRRNNVRGFMEYAAYSGVGLAFAGMTYVLIIAISAAAYLFSYIGISTVNYALSLDFLVFGLLIIGFGIMITIQSIITAYQRRNFWSILVAGYNIFAVAFDIVMYAESFNQAASVIKAGNSRNRGNTSVIVILAVLVAFLIVHAAYKYGMDKAMGKTNAQVSMR